MTNNQDKTEVERFAEVMTKTKDTLDRFKSSVEGACKDLKESIMAFGDDIQSLPEHLQSAWLASYAAQLKAVDKVIEEALS